MLDSHMKKSYNTPKIKEVSLRRRTDLLGCSDSYEEMPCINGPIAMDYKDDPYNG